MGRIPDRWEDYIPAKQCVEGTSFLPFKVPLKQEITSNLAPNQQFTPDILMQWCQSQGHNLGLVIDLTFTKRYYNPKAFTDYGVEYQKIFVEGHEVPKMEVVEQFTSVVNDFLSRRPDGVIGVHCTHGINRTGYLICKFLIASCGVDPSLAISKFADARGYPIERENYLNNLQGFKSPEIKENVAVFSTKFIPHSLRHIESQIEEYVSAYNQFYERVQSRFSQSHVKSDFQHHFTPINPDKNISSPPLQLPEYVSTFS